MRAGVRARVVALATALVLAVLVITALSLLAVQRAVLLDSVDEVLSRQSEAVVEQLDARTPFEDISGQGDDESFSRVLSRSGTVIARTAFLPIGIEDLARTSPASEYQTVANLGDGADYRVLTRQRGDAVVQVGTPLDDVNESVSALGWGLLVAVPAASFVLACLVWLLVGRVLRPVELIREQVAEISGSSLHRRVPQPTSGDEIGRLAKTMNGMLDRLEGASQRQRRFVADASHELRTPLARIRAQLEVSLAHPESGDPVATQRSILKDAVSLQALIDDLLALAQADADTQPRRLELVDLDDLVANEVLVLGVAATIETDVSAVSGAQVTGDPVQLSRVIRNVLDNAARHGATRVSVSLAETNGVAELAIADNGEGIPPEFHEAVFERFVRVDSARTPDEGGTGLGLAIARGIVTAHGGTIEIDAGHSPGARLVLRIPTARTPTAPNPEDPPHGGNGTYPHPGRRSRGNLARHLPRTST